MKAIITQIRLQFTESNNTEIVLTTTAKLQQETAELKGIIANGKIIRRSLTSPLL
jgi:hypothetical protein